MWDDFDLRDFRTSRVPMRHGHRKRLDQPKRGKAAIRAQIQGQGSEVLRGRSAFQHGQRSRRWHGSPEWHGKYGDMFLPVRRRRQVCREMREDETDFEPAEPVEEEFQDETLEEDVVVEVASSEAMVDETESVSSFHDAFETDTESSWSFVSCHMSSCSTASQCESPAAKAPKVLTRWEQALLTAELTAAIYAAYLQEQGLLPAAKARSRRQPRQKRERPLAIEVRLARELQTTVIWDAQEGSKTQPKQLPRKAAKVQPFDDFRRRFLEDHGMAFCSALRAEFRCPFSLKATPLSEGVKEQFLAARKELEGKIIPTYHGTAERNLASIYQKGLLVPNLAKNGIRVANGSAHGVGIYTARQENPRLSLSFARDARRQLLVCGVLDDAAPVSLQTGLALYGTYTLKAESETVRHVGDAVVIFDSRRVAPLFLATCLMARPQPSKMVPRPPRHVGPRTRLRKTPPQQPLSGRELQVLVFLSRRGARKRRP